MDPAIRKMSRELTKMNQSLSPYINQAIDVTKEIGYHMEKTSEAMSKLGMLCASIHKCYKSVGDKFDFDSLSKIESIYSEFSKTLTSYSKIMTDERDNFSTNVENFFNFAVCEMEGIDEVLYWLIKILNLRNDFSVEYKEKKQLLEAKKEAVYPTMDFKKWEIDQDNLPVPKGELVSNKATALKYMFPKASSSINLRTRRTSKI